MDVCKIQLNSFSPATSHLDICLLGSPSQMEKFLDAVMNNSGRTEILSMQYI